ncbi:mechanosensitive ion channel domain-containing protein [Lysobacter humi (ex Lee et al. 2017)]
MSFSRAAGALLAALLVLSPTSGAAVAPPASPAAAASKVPTDADARLAHSVARRLHAVPDLHDITVTATAAEVRLDGRVAGLEDRAHAEQIARQQPGVRAVDNRVQLSTGLVDRLRVALGQVYGKLIGLVAKLPLLLVAGLIVLLAWWIARRVTRHIHLSRFSARNPYIDALVGRLLRWGIVLLGLLVALDLLEATAIVGALLGSAGVVGIAVGFAFRDIAENYVAGILLSLRRGFAPGDHVLVEKYEGKVVALTARSTLLMTFDGNQVSVPNALVFKSVVTNFSQNDNRRFEFTTVIDVAESAGESQRVALAAIAGVDGVLPDPAPSSVVDGYLGGGIQLKFHGWVNQRASDLGKVRSEAVRAVKSAFEKARIDGPRPVQYVFTAPLPEDVAERMGISTAPRNATEPAACGDTSVNHDIDAQLDAERKAHVDDTLI